MLVAVQLERHVDLLRVHVFRVEVLINGLLIPIQRHGDEVRLIANALELPGQVVPRIGLHGTGCVRRHPSCIRGVPYTPTAVGARVALGSEDVLHPAHRLVHIKLESLRQGRI